jgi:hypothetical protein
MVRKMIHPDTEVKYINDQIGCGIFATAFIPKGTIVFVKDPLDIEVTETQYAVMPGPVRQVVDKYSYIDENGIRIVSWDNAKYINHRCDCNSINTGYGFEIAIKDIFPGDELTDDYGLFNLDCEFEVSCGCDNCRGVIRGDDLERYHEVWDSWIIESLKQVRSVEQPLWYLVDDKTQNNLNNYLDNTEKYCSVKNLIYKPACR